MGASGLCGFFALVIYHLLYWLGTSYYIPTMYDEGIGITWGEVYLSTDPPPFFLIVISIGHLFVIGYSH